MKKLNSFERFNPQKVEVNMCKLIYGGKELCSSFVCTEGTRQGCDEATLTTSYYDDGLVTQEMVTHDCCDQK